MGTRRARSRVPRCRNRATDESYPRRDAAIRSHGRTDLVHLAASFRGGRRSPDRTPSSGGGGVDSHAAAASSRRPGCVRTRAATRTYWARPARVRMQCHPRPLRRLVAVRDVAVKMSEHRTLAVRMPDLMAMRVAAPQCRPADRVAVHARRRRVPRGRLAAPGDRVIGCPRTGQLGCRGPGTSWSVSSSSTSATAPFR